MVTAVNEVQPLSRLSARFVSRVGRVMFFKFTHWAKADWPISVMESGSRSSVNW